MSCPGGVDEADVFTVIPIQEITIGRLLSHFKDVHVLIRYAWCARKP